MCMKLRCNIIVLSKFEFSKLEKSQHYLYLAQIINKFHLFITLLHAVYKRLYDPWVHFSSGHVSFIQLCWTQTFKMLTYEFPLKLKFQTEETWNMKVAEWDNEEYL